ncbi:MAG: PIG-L family deacetylase [Bacteroidota bacterium]
MTTNKYLFLFILLGFHTNLFAQSSSVNAPGRILQEIRKLKVLKSVLYIGAHPDDENNRLIAYLANGELAEIGYLSLSRGDGGQNLIGTELREELGILRTQELLAARRIDGGKQYFGTANDFGYSKTPQETFTIWDKEKLLSDMVWVIRKTRPDVLITRFSHLPSNTHGHHTASAILAFEAFDAAAAPSRFKEQLSEVQPWQAKRLVWNCSPGPYEEKDDEDKNGMISINTGKYNSLLGKSYGEIAAEGRSMHKSQGMGAKSSRGETVEYFKSVKGTKPIRSLFDGIDTTWQSVPGAEKLNNLLTLADKTFNAADPSGVVPLLIAARAELEKLPVSHWKKIKTAAIEEVIRQALGLFLEANTNCPYVSPGDSLALSIEMVNRSSVPLKIRGIKLPFASQMAVMDSSLRKNAVTNLAFNTLTNKTLPYSQPYWLTQKGTLGMFKVNNQQEVGLAENPSSLFAELSLEITGKTIVIKLPLVFKYIDPIAGEVKQPLALAPPVFVDLTKKAYIFSDNQAQKIQVRVKSGRDRTGGTLRLKLDSGWHIQPASIPFYFTKKDSEQLFEFRVSPPATATETQLTAQAVIDDATYDNGFKMIRYDHIPTQIYYPPASAKAVKLDLIRAGTKIAYLKGAGDLVAESLQQAGYEVTFLTESQLNATNLEKYDALIVGIRAYNVNDKIDFYKDVLLDYMKNGGNLIVQYNTDFDLPVKNFAPYPFEISGQARVTDENSKVTFLNPAHPVLNFPNKITEQDFRGWVQERGSYFPVKWDAAYEPVIGTSDPGEANLNGCLLIAKVGKGHFVYTTLSWFRQLPAGVPGAYRIMANLIGLK